MGTATTQSAQLPSPSPRSAVRKPKQRFRVRLGAFYLQGDLGWGQLAQASALTNSEADAKLTRLRKMNIKAVKVEV